MMAIAGMMIQAFKPVLREGGGAVPLDFVSGWAWRGNTSSVADRLRM